MLGSIFARSSDGGAMGCLMGSHVTNSYFEPIMVWWRELAKYLENKCQEYRIAEVGTIGGNIGKGGTITSIIQNHNLFIMLGLARISQTLAFQRNENRNHMAECNASSPNFDDPLPCAAIHYKIVSINGILVQSSPTIIKEVPFAGVRHPIRRFPNFWCLTKSLNEWSAQVHNQDNEVRRLHFYPP